MSFPILPRATHTSALGFLFAAIASAHALMPDDDRPALLSSFERGTSAFSLDSTLPPPAANAPVIALAAYARAGWQATLSTRAHGTRGTVTIVDADTFRVDNFFYDGGGINVHFILAAADDYNTFRDARLVTDLNLLGTAHNGDSITIDLPTGTTFDNYNAISLWCLPAAANFGSGTFATPTPEPASVSMLALGAMTLGLSRRRREK